ncbi:MAG: CDP-alcohol phosphatidyltransferase family protein [Thermodesulfobacteriota bacterium]
MNIANILSASRLVIAPLLLFFAWSGWRGLFLAFGIIALVTDCLDGYLARRLNLTSELGARLDSWGDLAIYMAVPLSVWWLWPEIIHREAAFIVACLTGFAVPVLFGFGKFGRLTSYHTWGAKLSAVLLSTSILVLIWNGPSWPFRLATAIFLLAELEEVLITLLLPKWRADVPSVLVVLRERRRGGSG